MRCDEARAAASLRFDAELQAGAADTLDQHLGRCPACRTWVGRVEGLRHALRFEIVNQVPDIAGPVVDAIEGRLPASPRKGNRPAWAVPVAALVAGIVAGSTLVSGVAPTSTPRLVGADVPRQVAMAQVRLESMTARVSVQEHGWHPDVAERTYTGSLAYRAPEAVALQLEDITSYPSAAWTPNHVTVVLDGDRFWQRGPFGCPTDAQPACTPTRPRVRAINRQAPFADEGLAPLELVLPAGGFQVGETATVVENRRRIEGREAIGVVTTAAQLDGLLSGLRKAGNWREVHPTDPVELWLDADALVPLSVEVRAAEGTDRARWAAVRGYADDAGQPVLSIRLDDVKLNRAVPDSAFPAAPADAEVADAGFVEAHADSLGGPVPSWLPPGLNPARSGRLAAGGPETSVRTWTDGRSWVKVQSTTQWPGERLFGDLGPVPRRVDLGAAGVGYVGASGDRVALHGSGLDVVVTGSLATDDLQRIAASLGVTGTVVPAGWAGGEAMPLAEVLAGRPLLVASSPRGFAPPAAELHGDVAVFTYAGSGQRWFRLTQRAGDSLSPPLDADVRGVRVRGTTGRYTPSLGLLEWVEGGAIVGLDSHSVSLGELVDVAEGLQWSP